MGSRGGIFVGRFIGNRLFLRQKSVIYRLFGCYFSRTLEIFILWTYTLSTNEREQSRPHCIVLKFQTSTYCVSGKTLVDLQAIYQYRNMFYSQIICLFKCWIIAFCLSLYFKFYLNSSWQIICFLLGLYYVLGQPYFPGNLMQVAWFISIF